MWRLLEILPHSKISLTNIWKKYKNNETIKYCWYVNMVVFFVLAIARSQVLCFLKSNMIQFFSSEISAVF